MIDKEKIKSLILKLDNTYNEIKKLEYEIINIKVKYERLLEEKELLENMIMFSYNDIERQKQLDKIKK